MSGIPQTTPLSQLLAQDNSGLMSLNPQDAHNERMQDNSQFAQGRLDPRMDKSGYLQPPGQGLSSPETVKREFFGLKEIDYKTLFLVFAIIFLLTSSFFSSCVKSYVPGVVGSDGKGTILCSLIAAILGTVLFAAVKFVGRF